MKPFFLGLLAFVSGFAFVSTAQASHTDHSQNDTYNINVNINGSDVNDRYHRQNRSGNRYNYVPTHSPYVSNVSGYGSVRHLPSSRSYTSYTPYKHYNTYGKQYHANNFYQTQGSKYDNGYNTYTRTNNTYARRFSRFNNVDSKKPYTPMKERYTGSTCDSHH